MANNSEAFRTELISRLLQTVPQDQIRTMLPILDQTLSGYDVSRKPLELIPVDGIPESMKAFIASKAICNCSPGTLKIYTLRLTDFFGMMKKAPSDITAGDIRMYLFYYKSQRSASDSYLDEIRRILNSFFSWCVTNEYLIRNPCASLEKTKYQEKEREPLAPYDLEVFRWHCKSLREKALVDFFFSTGMRLSECHDCNKSDINWKDRVVIIRHGKGNKRREVCFNAESELSLRKYLESRTDSEDALFVSERRPHGRLSARGIENVIRKVSARSGMHVYPHKLRHTFATAGLRGGMSLEMLQSLMGHAEPRTTMIYAKLNQADVRREYSRIYS